MSGSTRSALARTRRDALRSCPVSGNGAEHLPSLLGAWLEVATASEVRRGWSRHWGALPRWAVV